MKNKAKMTLGLLAICSLAACSEAQNPELSPEQLNANIYKLAIQNYELAANTGDEDALDTAIDKWENGAKNKDLNAIKSLISFYEDTRDAKELKYWKDYKVLTENEIFTGKINGSLLVGNRDLAISTCTAAIFHMQKNLKEVKKLDEKALVKLAYKVIEKVDPNQKKYELMSILALHHMQIDALNRRENIEKLLNEAFAKNYFKANDYLTLYYLDAVKDAQLAKNTLDRHFNSELSDNVLKALIAKNLADEAYIFFKKHIKAAPDSSMAIMANFYKNDKAKVYDLIKARFLALESWAKSADFVKYQKNIINYIDENKQDGFAHYMAAYTYETSKDYNNGDILRMHLDKAIELGCTLAYTKLAELYAEGKYVEIDYLKAFELFKKAEIDNKEYSLAKQSQLLEKITKFSGKNKVEIATSKLAFYNSLKEIGVSAADKYIELAKQEQKTAFINENSRNLTNAAKRIETNINNLIKSKDSLTKLYQKNTTARNTEAAVNTYERFLNGIKEDFEKVSAIIAEASSYGIDYLAQDAELKSIFENAKVAITSGNADLAKMKDGSFGAESAVKLILSDPEAKTVNPEIQANYAIIREVGASFNASAKKLNQLYVTMQRAHKNNKQKEAKILLSEIDTVNASIAKYDNALATLSAIGGVSATFIKESKAPSTELSNYIKQIQAEAKKNADSALESLLNFF